MNKHNVINTQASLLAFLSGLARELTEDLGIPITVVNFDAYVDLKELPAGDVIGIGEFSIQRDPREAVEVVSAILMAGTSDDPNNMRLTKIASKLYDSVDVEEKIDFLEESSGNDLGSIVCFGESILLPVEKNLVTKILQGVSFMGGLLPFGE